MRKLSTYIGNGTHWWGPNGYNYIGEERKEQFFQEHKQNLMMSPHKNTLNAHFVSKWICGEEKKKKKAEDTETEIMY